MPLPLFVVSPECRSRKHCEACLDPSPVGKGWRERMSNTFRMPDECPWGVRWVSDSAAPAETVRGIPRDRWPWRVRVLAKLARPDDRGIGDVVRRLADRVSGDAMKRWYKALTGKDCGCGDRQQRLNQRYPLPPPPSP